MERLKQHQAIVRQLLDEIAQLTPSDQASETQIIMDDTHGHYLLFSVGWSHNRREYLPFVHLDIHPDGKVYIQHDGTDLRIADRLVEAGIDKQHIVLAFQSPNRRKLIPDFALE